MEEDIEGASQKRPILYDILNDDFDDNFTTYGVRTKKRSSILKQDGEKTARLSKRVSFANMLQVLEFREKSDTSDSQEITGNVSIPLTNLLQTAPIPERDGTTNTEESSHQPSRRSSLKLPSVAESQVIENVVETNSAKENSENVSLLFLNKKKENLLNTSKSDPASNNGSNKLTKSKKKRVSVKLFDVEEKDEVIDIFNPAFLKQSSNNVDLNRNDGNPVELKAGSISAFDSLSEAIDKKLPTVKNIIDAVEKTNISQKRVDMNMTCIMDDSFSLSLEDSVQEGDATKRIAVNMDMTHINEHSLLSADSSSEFSYGIENEESITKKIPVNMNMTMLNIFSPTSVSDMTDDLSDYNNSILKSHESFAVAKTNLIDVSIKQRNTIPLKSMKNDFTKCKDSFLKSLELQKSVSDDSVTEMHVLSSPKSVGTYVINNFDAHSATVSKPSVTKNAVDIDLNSMAISQSKSIEVYAEDYFRMPNTNATRLSCLDEVITKTLPLDMDMTQLHGPGLNYDSSNNTSTLHKYHLDPCTERIPVNMDITQMNVMTLKSLDMSAVDTSIISSSSDDKLLPLHDAITQRIPVDMDMTRVQSPLPKCGADNYIIHQNAVVSLPKPHDTGTINYSDVNITRPSMACQTVTKRFSVENNVTMSNRSNTFKICALSETVEDKIPDDMDITQMKKSSDVHDAIANILLPKSVAKDNNAARSPQSSEVAQGSVTERIPIDMDITRVHELSPELHDTGTIHCSDINMARPSMATVAKIIPSTMDTTIPRSYNVCVDNHSTRQNNNISRTCAPSETVTEKSTMDMDITQMDASPNSDDDIVKNNAFVRNKITAGTSLLCDTTKRIPLNMDITHLNTSSLKLCNTPVMENFMPHNNSNDIRTSNSPVTEKIPVDMDITQIDILPSRTHNGNNYMLTSVLCEAVTERIPVNMDITQVDDQLLQSIKGSSNATSTKKDDLDENNISTDANVDETTSSGIFSVSTFYSKRKSNLSLLYSKKTNATEGKPSPSPPKIARLSNKTGNSKLRKLKGRKSLSYIQKTSENKSDSMEITKVETAAKEIGHSTDDNQPSGYTRESNSPLSFNDVSLMVSQTAHNNANNTLYFNHGIDLTCTSISMVSFDSSSSTNEISTSINNFLSKEDLDINGTVSFEGKINSAYTANSLCQNNLESQPIFYNDEMDLTLMTKKVVYVDIPEPRYDNQQYESTSAFQKYQNSDHTTYCNNAMETTCIVASAISSSLLGSEETNSLTMENNDFNYYNTMPNVEEPIDNFPTCPDAIYLKSGSSSHYLNASQNYVSSQGSSNLVLSQSTSRTPLLENTATNPFHNFSQPDGEIQQQFEKEIDPDYKGNGLTDVNVAVNESIFMPMYKDLETHPLRIPKPTNKAVISNESICYSTKKSKIINLRKKLEEQEKLLKLMTIESSSQSSDIDKATAPLNISQMAELPILASNPLTGEFGRSICTSSLVKSKSMMPNIDILYKIKKMNKKIAIGSSMNFSSSMQLETLLFSPQRLSTSKNESFIFKRPFDFQTKDTQLKPTNRSLVNSFKLSDSSKIESTSEQLQKLNLLSTSTLSSDESFGLLPNSLLHSSFLDSSNFMDPLKSLVPTKKAKFVNDSSADDNVLRQCSISAGNSISCSLDFNSGIPTDMKEHLSKDDVVEYKKCFTDKNEMNVSKNAESNIVYEVPVQKANEVSEFTLLSNEGKLVSEDETNAENFDNVKTSSAPESKETQNDAASFLRNIPINTSQSKAVVMRNYSEGDKVYTMEETFGNSIIEVDPVLNEITNEEQSVIEFLDKEDLHSIEPTEEQKYLETITKLHDKEAQSSVELIKKPQPLEPVQDIHKKIDSSTESTNKHQSLTSVTKLHDKEAPSSVELIKKPQPSETVLNIHNNIDSSTEYTNKHQSLTSVTKLHDKEYQSSIELVKKPQPLKPVLDMPDRIISSCTELVNKQQSLKSTVALDDIVGSLSCINEHTVSTSMREVHDKLDVSSTKPRDEQQRLQFAMEIHDKPERKSNEVKYETTRIPVLQTNQSNTSEIFIEKPFLSIETHSNKDLKNIESLPPLILPVLDAFTETSAVASRSCGNIVAESSDYKTTSKQSVAAEIMTTKDVKSSEIEMIEEDEVKEIAVFLQDVIKASRQLKVRWSIEKLSSSDVTISFLWGTFLMDIGFENSKSMKKRIASVRLESKFYSPASDAALLTHKVLYNSFTSSSLKDRYQDSSEMLQLIEEVYDVAKRAETLIIDLECLSIRHKFSLESEENRLNVEVLSLTLGSQFKLSFLLDLTTYSISKMVPTVTHMCGKKFSEELLLTALSKVPPGRRYFFNMVRAAETVI